MGSRSPLASSAPMAVHSTGISGEGGGAPGGGLGGGGEGGGLGGGAGGGGVGGGGEGGGGLGGGGDGGGGEGGGGVGYPPWKPRLYLEIGDSLMLVPGKQAPLLCMSVITNWKPALILM